MQKEVDYLVIHGPIVAFEYKLTRTGKNKITQAFNTGCPKAILGIIYQDNYLDFFYKTHVNLICF